jgi:hypothetical protein
MIEFNDRRESEHNHRYNPNSPHGMKPEGECPACDKMWQEIHAQQPDDPFEGLS